MRSPKEKHTNLTRRWAQNQQAEQKSNTMSLSGRTCLYPFLIPTQALFIFMLKKGDMRSFYRVITEIYPLVSDNLSLTNFCPGKFQWIGSHSSSHNLYISSLR